jgi:polysaccharide export outer membrane protein
MTRTLTFLTVLALSLGPAARAVDAQAPQAVAPSGAAAAGVPLAPDYVIGPDDVLSILFWRDKDLSAPEVTVRPDGKVTLPLLNDVQAAGRTPEELGDAIRDAARKFVEDPNPTVIVKEIKSRRVFITGRIEKPGPYPLNGKTTILQLIAMAGGLREFVDGKNISLMRSEKDRQSVFAFNYQDVVKKGYIHQNIELKPGDVVVVP